MQDLVLIEDSEPVAEPGNDLPVTSASGLALTWADVIWNVPGANGPAARFRFVAPALAQKGAVSEDQIRADLADLCRSFALPRIAAMTPPPAQIIISISDRPVPFGQTNPDAVQVFDAYDVKDGDCEWSLF